ncbi:MAG: FtsX-like permease family protein [Ardenticatenaceae bacterium]|nr:FtsX-like permease family protein [Ardenticatenaceae bacterium]
MLTPRWKKVLRDLWGNKTRTLLVVLSIAVGVFALGMILGTRILLGRDLPEIYLATNPFHAAINTGPFDESLIDVVRRIDGVADATARRTVTLRYQTGPDEWGDLEINVLPDFEQINISRIFPEAGEWPPPVDGLVIERASLPYIEKEIGDSLVLETPDGRLRTLPIVGIVHDMGVQPVQFRGVPYAYTDLATLSTLNLDESYDQVRIRVEGQNLTEDDVRVVVQRVEDKLQKGGISVGFAFIPPPDEHPSQNILDPLTLILGLLGALALGLSGFLVVNIISGLLAQHILQIGIMKAVGARTGQISQMYFLTVIVFGILSLFIAVPLGGLAAYALASYMSTLLNFDLRDFYIPGQVVALQVALGILVPLLAALYPVIRGTGISVREAISETGLGKGQFGSNLLDRLVNWVTGTVLALSRPMQISLRNTIRRKARLLLTLITLTLGGAIFIAIISVYTSLMATLDDTLSYFNFDVTVSFEREYRLAEIQQEALTVPGVVSADAWLGTSVRRIRANGDESNNLSLLGTEAETDLINPVLTNGRWLRPTDVNAVVINSAVLDEEPDIKLGDTVRLKLGNKEYDWQVIGIVRSALTGPILYANKPHVARLLNSLGRTSTVQIKTTSSDPDAQAVLAKQLEEHFNRVGMNVASTRSVAQIRETIQATFAIIVSFMSVMAVLIASVGGLGLMGTMSINVLERTREIGVLRAVGASDGSVLRIVLVEGVFIGLISWIIAFALSYPIGQALSNLVGTALLQSPLTYVFSTGGGVGWLAAVLLIASLASYLPARNASRLSVRETLAYE